MSTIGYATLQVIPSLKGVVGDVSKQIGGPMAEAGKKAGNQLGQGVASGVEQSKSAVQKAAQQVVAARNKEADAAGKVKVAEAQLQSLRDKGVSDAGRLAAAEEKVAKAKRDHVTQASKLKDATKAEERANSQLAEAQKKVTSTQDRATASTGRFGGALGGIKSKFREASTGADGLSSKVKGLGSQLATGLGFGAGLGIAGITTSLAGMGRELANVNKTITFTTGATGDKLKEMNAQVLEIGKTSPKSLEEIATSFASVAKATQLTGQPLTDMTKRVIKLGMMGQNVGVTELTRSMQAFGIPASDMAKQLDSIYAASKGSGLSMGELTGTLAVGAPIFRGLNLSMGQAAGLLGDLKSAGLPAQSATMGLNKAMVNLSKGGGDVKQKLLGAVGQIQALVKSGNSAAATQMAAKLFGVRNANQFVNAIRTGKVSVDSFNKSLKGQQASILDAKGGVVGMSGAWQMLKNNLIAEVAPAATKVFSLLSDGIVWFRTHGIDAIHSFFDVFKSSLGFIGDVAGAIGRNKPLLVAMGAAAAGVAAGFLAIKIQAAGAFAVGKVMAMVNAFKAWRAATQGMTAAQIALNLAQKANPIGLIVGIIVAAGVALWAFFTKTETGRKMWAKIWGGIKTAVSAAWGVIKPILSGIGAAFGWIWRAIQPAIDFVKRFWQILVFGLGPIGIIVGVVTQLIKHWDLVKAAFSAVGAAAMWLWNSVITPVFNGIKAAIGVWWTGVQIYFNAWKTAITWVGQAATWLWQNAIQPAWNGIVAAGQFLWSGVSTIFEWFKTGISVLGNVVSTVVNAVIVPLWNAVKAGAEFMWNGIKTVFDWIKSGWNLMATGIQVVVDSIIKPAFEGVKTALGAVGAFFGTIVDGIKTAWDKLKGYVAVPINFVITTVWNNGLLKAWNTIAGFLPGLKTMNPLNPVQFAAGGPVPMSAGAQRGKDSVHALMMPDEHVWDVADVRKSGGHGAQYRMRAMVEKGIPFTWTPNGIGAAAEGGPLPRFGDGGAVNAGDKLAPLGGEGGLQPIAILMRRIIFRLWKQIKDIGGYRQDAYPEHPSGRALDVMVPDMKTGDEVNAWTHANAKKFPIEHTIWKQRWRPQGNINGTPMEDRGSPTQNHMDHVHNWYKEQAVNPNVVPAGLVGKGGGPSDAEMLAIIRKKISEILDKALNPVKQGMASVIGAPPPEWLGIPPKALDETKNKALDKALDVAMKLGDKLEGVYNKAKSVVKTATNIVTAPARSVIGLFRDQGGTLPTGQSIVTNETGKPEAVLNWQQLNSVKEMMDKGASLSEAIAKVGASKPQSDQIPPDAVVLKPDATAQDVADAADKLKAAAEQKPTTTTNPGQPNTNGADQAGQPKNQLKSFKELGQDAGGLIAEGIADFFGLPSWITDPGNAIQGDDGSNVRKGSTAGNSAIDDTNKPDTTDLQYGDGSTIQQKETPLTTKMPDLGVAGQPKITYSPSGGAEQWRPMAKWAIDYVNQSMKGAAQEQAMVEQIGDESGGNPKAVNNWDINAQNGVPSGGLLQVIEPTFQAHRDPKLPNDKFDPAANLVAALRYYVPKYGKDLTARWGHGKGGYRRGGYTGNLGLDEIAGVVHGREFVMPAGPTRRNFALLSAMHSGADVEGALVAGSEQWGSVADRAPRKLVGAGSGARTTNITVYGHTAGDIAQEIDRHQWRGSGGYGSRMR